MTGRGKEGEELCGLFCADFGCFVGTVFGEWEDRGRSRPRHLQGNRATLIWLDKLISFLSLAP